MPKKKGVIFLMAITGSLQKKNGYYYSVINMPLPTGGTKPKWEKTGLKVRGNANRAKDMLKSRLSELNNLSVPYYEITVSDYFSQWLKEIQSEIRPNTYRTYVNNMKNHIIPYFEKKKILLQDLTPFQLEEYYKSRMQTKSKNDSSKTLSATTVKHHHQNISKALSDALRRGYISVNPATAAKVPKAEKFKAEFLEPEEVNEMLILFKNNIIELPVTLCAIYGFRRSEVLGLKWHNINFKKRQITIAETLQQNTGGEYTDKPKTESSYRILPMTESVYTLLQSHKELQMQRKKLMGNCYSDNDYVCTWQDGKVITPNYLTSKFHEIISKSTLPHIRLHDLRHSVASNLLSNGFTVVQVQEWMGHANASTTLDIYSHAAKDSKNNISKALENMINISDTLR